MFTKKVREELNEVDKFTFKLKRELAYARALLTDGSEEDIGEFLENGLDVDYDEPDQIELQHLKLDKERLQDEVKALNKKNHDLAKSMSNAMHACKKGYDFLGWHFPDNNTVPVNLPGVVDELVKGLTDINDVLDQHDDAGRSLVNIRDVLRKFNL